MRIFLFILCYLGWFCPTLLADSSFDALRSQYSSLRNTDSAKKKLAERASLGGKFLALTAEPLPDRESVLSLTYAAVLYAEIFSVTHDLKKGRVVRDALQKLEQDFPDNPLTDDAYLSVSQVLPEHDKQLLISLIEEKFPHSDSVAALKTKVANETPSDQRRNNGQVIVLDPGHGGEDLGAVSADGSLYEKDITLDIARRILKILADTMPSATVLLTRTGDSFVPLEVRTRFANDKKADLFVSIHNNASENQTIHGIESYILEASGDKVAEALAARENGEFVSDDVSFFVSDLIQVGKSESSKKLAESLHGSVLKELRATPWKSKDLGVRKGPFYVLVGAHMPATLIELGFLSNTNEAAHLSDEAMRQTLATGVAVGIKRFLSDSK